MHFPDILKERGPTISSEFFPPRAGKVSRSLDRTISERESFEPGLVSVTCDAEAVERVGIDSAAGPSTAPPENEVAGIHLLTLNQSRAIREIYANPGLRAPASPVA